MNKWIWLAVTLLLVGFVYLTKAVLLPFLAGLAVAYFLDPLTDKLEAKKIPRGLAAALVISLFFITLAGLILALWPILQAQIASVSETLPSTVAKLRPWLNGVLQSLSDNFGFGDMHDIDSMLATLSDQLFTRLQHSASSLLKGGLAIFNIMSLVLISPVVAFYLLRDWDLLVARLDSWLPPAQATTIRKLSRNIDTVLAGFVRGQMLMCIVMGVLYGLGWMLVGLKFALALGALAGILSFIPFVGALFAALIAFVIGIGQWGFDPLHLALVLGIFFIVQLLEGAVLSPRLIGERVGLHPVWVLFAVFAGGEIMGFVGVLISVPAAAAIAVLVRHAIDTYLEHYQIMTEPVVTEPIPEKNPK